MAEEPGAAFQGSRVGSAYMVKGSPEVSMVVVCPCAAQTAIQCWWQMCGAVSFQPESSVLPSMALSPGGWGMGHQGHQGGGGSPSLGIPG